MHHSLPAHLESANALNKNNMYCYRSCRWLNRNTYRVRAQVVPVPPGYLYAHHALLDEFRNASVWPKHLLMQYAWAQAPSADALAALYLALVACASYGKCTLNGQNVTPPREPSCLNNARLTELCTLNQTMMLCVHGCCPRHSELCPVHRYMMSIAALNKLKQTCFRACRPGGVHGHGCGRHRRVREQAEGLHGGNGG